jgi:hypothetical protein
MVRIGVRAPTLRIKRIALGALLHFADGGLQGCEHVR